MSSQYDIRPASPPVAVKSLHSLLDDSQSLLLSNLNDWLESGAVKSVLVLLAIVTLFAVLCCGVPACKRLLQSMAYKQKKKKKHH